MRTLRTAVLIAATAATALAVPAGAQRNPIRPQGRRGMGVQQPQPDSMRRRRAELEGAVRQRIERQMQVRLGLTDDQVAKVRDINARYQQRHQARMQQEREIRMSIREEWIGGDTTRQAVVADLLDRMLRTQRQRIDLMEQEQKDLSAVLTPMQRAGYIGLEEQLRQRIQGMQQQGGRMGPPPDGGPGLNGPGMGGQMGPGGGMGPGAGIAPGGRLGPGARMGPGGQLPVRRPPPMDSIPQA